MEKLANSSLLNMKKEWLSKRSKGYSTSSLKDTCQSIKALLTMIDNMNYADINKN